MAERFVLKQFAGSATNNGAFGAAQATGAGVQPVANIEDVQSLNAFEQGWDSATLTADKLPALEEMQGLEALLCKAIKELYSEGIPLWISGETYYQDSRAVFNGKVYRNKTGSYTANNPATDTANWELDKPDTAGTADKLGTTTIGDETIPIYLDNGTATPCKQTAITIYNNAKTYFKDEVVLNVDEGDVKLYKSLSNNNTSALSDTTKWEEISLVAGAVLGQLANKADIDASNFNASGKSLLSGLGMPSSRYIDLTLGASGSTYTAPANGWFAGWSSPSVVPGTYVLFSVGNVDDGYASEIYRETDISYQMPLLLPVKKETVITVTYHIIGLSMFRFYYAEGENS